MGARLGIRRVLGVALIVSAALRPGSNTLDVKVYQVDLDWGFYCWITDQKNARWLVQTDEGGAWKDRQAPEPAISKPEAGTPETESPSAPPSARTKDVPTTETVPHAQPELSPPRPLVG